MIKPADLINRAVWPERLDDRAVTVRPVCVRCRAEGEPQRNDPTRVRTQWVCPACRAALRNEGGPADGA